MNTDTEVYFQSPSCCHKYSFEKDKDQCRGLILPRVTEQGLLGAYCVILFYSNWSAYGGMYKEVGSSCIMGNVRHVGLTPCNCTLQLRIVPNKCTVYSCFSNVSL